MKAFVFVAIVIIYLSFTYFSCSLFSAFEVAALASVQIFSSLTELLSLFHAYVAQGLEMWVTEFRDAFIGSLPYVIPLLS